MDTLSGSLVFYKFSCSQFHECRTSLRGADHKPRSSRPYCKYIRRRSEQKLTRPGKQWNAKCALRFFRRSAPVQVIESVELLINTGCHGECVGHGHGSIQQANCTGQALCVKPSVTEGRGTDCRRIPDTSGDN